MVRDHEYCLVCRTCPHGCTYVDFWDPACPRCVRDLHTYLTFDGPRIRDLDLYTRDALRWGIAWDDIQTWRFDEEEDLTDWTSSKHEPFHKWNLERPPHFDLSARSRTTDTCEGTRG